MSNRFYGLYFTCFDTLNCWNVSMQALWSSVCNLFCGSRNTYIFFKPLSHFSTFECLVCPMSRASDAFVFRDGPWGAAHFHFRLCETGAETAALGRPVPAQNRQVAEHGEKWQQVTSLLKALVVE